MIERAQRAVAAENGVELDYSQAEVLKPQEMLRQFDEVNICAPMVRYSKLAFRQLVAQYDTHVTYTPMILAQEFSRSASARDSDFTTHSHERGIFRMRPASRSKVSPGEHEDERPTRLVRGNLIAQFAASAPEALADAAELISPHVDGLDLNCGCPQKWAYSEGIGCALLEKPEMVSSMVRAVKNRVGEEFPVLVKIRVDRDLSRTNELITSAIGAGADVLTVHGRTRFQPSDSFPVDLSAIKFARECARDQVPVVANGDVFSREDAQKTRQACGVSGVMSARGLLANPALFSGYDRTPLEAVQRFIQYATDTGLIFALFHRHVAYMLESHMPSKAERTFFNSLSSHAAVIDYCEDVFGLDFTAR